MKIAVVYHSKTGNTAKVASWIVDGLGTVEGVEAKAFSIDEVDRDFVKESCGLIVGTPVYGGTMSGPLKVWLDTQIKGLELPGKLGGAFSTAAFVHGGCDLAIQSILNHLMITGMILYTGGASKGQPVIHFGPAAIAPELDKYADTFKIYGKRMAEKAKELF